MHRGIAMKNYLFAGVALAVVACSGAPVSENHAAREAARCFQWPAQVITGAAKLERPPRLEQAMTMDFENAKSVVISRNGRCGTVDPTRVISGTLIYQLPPSSFTVGVDEEGRSATYILFLIESDERGNRRFLGMKGDMAVLEITPSAPPPVT